MFDCPLECCHALPIEPMLHRVFVRLQGNMAVIQREISLDLVYRYLLQVAPEGKGRATRAAALVRLDTREGTG